MERLIVGMTDQQCQEFDRWLTTEITEKLFKDGAPFGQDLAARNIQRGRDHGIPSYAEFYKLYGPSSDPNGDMSCWNRRPQSFSRTNWNLLRQVYCHPQDIELFTGGLLEKRTYGRGLLGVVFREIQAQQFERLKDGDRFFFTHKGQVASFTKRAIKAIKRRKFSDIICDNTNIEKVPTNAFMDPCLSNAMKKCATGTTPLDVSVINIV